MWDIKVWNSPLPFGSYDNYKKHKTNLHKKSCPTVEKIKEATIKDTECELGLEGGVIYLFVLVLGFKP